MGGGGRKGLACSRLSDSGDEAKKRTLYQTTFAPSYWAGCGLMAPCKLAPTNWPRYPPSSLLQQCKACDHLLELTRFSAVYSQDLRSCLILWIKSLQRRNPEKKIVWSDELLLTFNTAQRALENHRSITIPQPQDALWIVTGGSVKNRGVAATLYKHRNGKLLLAGFFSAKLRKHQVTWLPCEIEALGIGAAIRHFAPYNIQSPHTREDGNRAHCRKLF